VISPATDPNSTTIEIWAQAANPKNRLRPGTTVQLLVTAQKIENTLVIPATGVLNQPDGSVAVLVVKSDHAKVRPVKLGIQNSDEVQISSGLQAGEQVVVTGGYGLPDNTRVKVESPAEPAKTDSGKTPSD
jgi:HlyD family secretion protein